MLLVAFVMASAVASVAEMVAIALIFAVRLFAAMSCFFSVL